jgi:CHAT domain-containing protein/tetratricopeptide (TPR) repeat protein
MLRRSKTLSFPTGVVLVGVLFTTSAALAQQPGSELDKAYTLGEQLQKKGDYTGAMERFRWCAAASREAGDDLRLATCLQLMGGTQRLTGDYVEAEASYREAIAFAGKGGDPRRQTYILNNLANLFGAQGRYAETIAMLRQCIGISEREKFEDAAPWQNLAISYALQGDHARSLDSFLSALKIYERQKNAGKVALVHYNLGILQLKQGNSVAARRELTEAQALAEKSGDRIIVAQAVGDLGRVLEREGHFREARESLEKSLALCRSFGNKACIGEGEMHLGNFHLAHAEPALAGQAFESARQTFEELNDSFNLADVFRGLGYVARLRLDYAAAKDYAGQAIALAEKIGDPDGQWQGQALLGLVAKDSGDLPAARSAYLASIAVIEKQRGKVGGGEEERQRFFEKAVYPYQQLALLEAADQHPFAALRAAERARVRVLLDMIAGGPEKIAGAMTGTERDEETRLLASVAGLNARMNRARGPDKDAFKVKYDGAWGRYENFRGALYVTHPELRTWRGESPVIDEAQLGSSITDDKTAWVEFLCSKDSTLLFVIARGASAEHPSVHVFPIAISRDALAKRTERFRSLLEKRDPGFRAEAAGLFRLLLGPAAGALQGKTLVHMVADGPLWELPFQALTDRAGRYWLETVTLAWAPSLTFLRDRKNTPASTGGSDLVAFGDPSIPGSPSIPLLREQIARIAALYDPAKTSVRLGAQADEKAFRQLAPDARVIHLATHGIADPENAMRSRVLLARSGSTGTSEDGWLEAWELTRMELHADVAVLSACETGRGRVTEGEGLVGLTWALFASGVRNVVVSQWRVETESTTVLMTSLHKGLRSGQTPAVALRGSVLALMKDPRYRHPFYWGAFVAAGN